MYSTAHKIKLLWGNYSLRSNITDNKKKLDLLTNATVVDDAIRFVSDRSKEKPKPSPNNSNEDNKEESKGPDYDEDEDQLEEEQEEQTRNITTATATTNRVFW